MVMGWEECPSRQQAVLQPQKGNCGVRLVLLVGLYGVCKPAAGELLASNFSETLPGSRRPNEAEERAGQVLVSASA